MSRRLRPSTTTKVDKRKRVVTYVTVEREIITRGPVAGAVAKVIRELRNQNGMTQQEVADLIGISRPALANIEIGRQRVLLEDIFDYARALRVSPKGLFAMVADAVAD